MTASRAFEDLTNSYLDLRWQFDPVQATAAGWSEFDHRLGDFGSQGIACLDRKTGDTIWERRDLQIYQPVRQGSSPIVDDKSLFVAYDGRKPISLDGLTELPPASFEPARVT